MGHMTPPLQTTQKPEVTKKSSNFFWPEIADMASAEAAARQGMWAAFFVAFVTAVVTGLAINGVSFGEGLEFDASAFVDVVIFLLVGLGILAKSRTAAVLGLVFYVYERIFMLVTVGPKGLLVAVIFILAFVSSVRGTFAIHRFRAATPFIPAEPERTPFDVDPLIGRIIFWLALAFALGVGGYLYYA